MRFSTVLILLVACCITVHSQPPLPLIPYPVDVKQEKGSYPLKSTMTVSSNFPEWNQPRLFNYLKAELKKQYGITVEKAAKGQTGDIRFSMMRMPTSGKPAYQLEVSTQGISITSNFEEPAFHAIQTLLQLMPADPAAKKEIPFVAVFDHARFQYRGMHLDVSRHFFPVSFIKRYIDYLAYHKLNTFHWHLTDDQGWRIEIKKYPRLTSVGAYRNGTIIGRYPGTGNDNQRYGDFYTQEEIKEVVQYAADHFITVIPEIEMPGHASAAIAAYPTLSCFPGESTRHPADCAWSGDTTGKQVQQTWGVFEDVFCAGKDNTFNFLQDVIDEVLTLFPSRYIHVGGDESPKDNWKRCPLCQQRIKDQHLKDEHELQSYFIQRMEKYLNSKGRTLIGWDEILEGGLAPKAIVMSWRGEQGGIDAARQKHNVIMTPGNPVYFDYSQSEKEDSVTIGGYNPLERVYAYEPVPRELTAEEGTYVLGAQANLWTEYITNPRKVEYMIFPRMSALSEVLWSPKEKRDWNDFEKRLQTQFKRYELWGANYSKAYYELRATVLPTNGYDGIRWQIANKYQSSSTSLYKKDADSVISGKSGNDTTSAGFSNLFLNSSRNPEQIIIRKSGVYRAEIYELIPMIEPVIYEADERFPPLIAEQVFHFNKATGKKITLINPASAKYPGDGAFTLINGVQNTRGMARSKEFLGFDGTDCEAIIDLGAATTITTVTAHVLDDKPSWIWLPSGMHIMVSDDGVRFSPAACTNLQGKKNSIICGFTQPLTARYIKVLLKNQGVIPEGHPGAGSKPWLFVDEIEVN